MTETKISPPDDLMDLPGFREAKERIESRGYKAGWLTRVADITAGTTYFLKNGKSNYRSDCPHYEGYYLDGLSGGVKCGRCTDVLPGHMWCETCSKEYVKCPFYVEQE